MFGTRTYVLVRNLWDPHGNPPQLCVFPWPSLGAGWSSAIPRPCRRVISGGVEVEVLRKGSVLHNYDKSNVLKKRKTHDLNWFGTDMYVNTILVDLLVDSWPAFPCYVSSLTWLVTSVREIVHVLCRLRRDDKSWTLNTLPYGFQTVIGTTLPFATPAGDEAKPGPQNFEVRFSTSQSIAQIRAVTPSLHSLPRGLLCHHGFQFPSVYHRVQGQNWQCSVTIH